VAVADLLAKVTPEQETLLRAIYGGLVALDYQEWPNWQYIEGTLRREELNARELLYSLPMVGRDEFGAFSYSAMWWDRRNLQSGSVVRLTVAASLQCEEFKQVGDWFIAVLRHIADKLKYAPLSPAKPREVLVTNKELQAACSPSKEFLRILPEMLRTEPFGLADIHGSDNKGTWQIKLRESLVEYEDVSDVRDYVERVTRLIAAKNAELNPSQVFETITQLGSPPQQQQHGTYVDLGLLGQIKTLDCPSWDLAKLAQLLGRDRFAARRS
jgi:hypothetical protein